MSGDMPLRKGGCVAIRFEGFGPVKGVACAGIRWLAVFLLFLLTPVPLPAETPTFQQLMDPAWMPQAQYGMRIERVEQDEAGLRILTTGAVLEADHPGESWLFRQRIGAERPVLRVHWRGPAIPRLHLVERTDGMVLAASDHPHLVLRANGDSLFMIHARQAVSLEIEHFIAPCFESSFENNHLIVDEFGGFGLYCSDRTLDDRYRPHDRMVAVCDLPADTVFWIAVCPPKPYDWERSFRDQVIWHWSSRNAYPDEATLTAWSRHGNIVLLQSELMLWKDWNLAFEPRAGAAEFARVRDTIHRLGMRMMVYTSPYYFLKGTDLEPHAINTFENFRGWPTGKASGENMELFLTAIEGLLREHRPDGLYFDGQYFENPAALYALARRTRALLGDAGLLEWHSTNALGWELCSLPPADAYCDFLLRGEGRELLHRDPFYLRYFVSGYNVSNTIGVLCTNRDRPTAELLEALRSNNVRLHTLAGWLVQPDLPDLIARYRASLGPGLRETFEAGLPHRQAAFSAEYGRRGREEQALRAELSWAAPRWVEPFDRLAGWQLTASALNPDPPTVEDGVLRITARASTFIYLHKPLEEPVGGVAVRLRRGSDGGASWGPGVCLRWPDGTLLRMGLRNDGLVEANIGGEQRLGGRITGDPWVRLRARWMTDMAAVDYAVDDGPFERLWVFRHGGRFLSRPADLCVGKIPYHGRSEDFSDPGPPGTFVVDEVAIFPPWSPATTRP